MFCPHYGPPKHVWMLLGMISGLAIASGLGWI